MIGQPFDEEVIVVFGDQACSKTLVVLGFLGVYTIWN